MTDKSNDKPEKELKYRDFLAMFQQAIKEITPEDVADVIHEHYDPIKVMEIQDTLFLLRQNQLKDELARVKERETAVKPPQKKGGRK